jgi:translation initiation factor 2 beta subunit (eIF-2beta)/eIF-5
MKITMCKECGSPNLREFYDDEGDAMVSQCLDCGYAIATEENISYSAYNKPKVVN